MNLPDDAFRKINALSAQVASLGGILEQSKELSAYLEPSHTVKRHLEELEKTRKVLAGQKLGYEVAALQDAMAKTLNDRQTEQFRIALGQSTYAREMATVKQALGYANDGGALAALRESFHVNSTYISEIEKLQKELYRNSLHAQELATLQAELQNTTAAAYAKDFMRGQAQIAAQQSVQGLRDHFSKSIADLQLEAQRPHLLMDAFQRATTWLEPLREIQQLASFSALEKYKTLANAADPLKLYRDTVEATARNPFNDLSSDSVRRIFESLNQFAEHVEDEGFDDEDIELEPRDITPYSDMAREQFGQVYLNRESIEAVVTTLMDAYQKLPSVRDKKIFVTIIYPFLLAAVFSCINPYTDFIVKQKLEAARQTTEKSVQQAARNSGAPPHVLSSFRFVTSQTLSVRVNGRIKSPVIGTLRFAQPIEILKKEGDWTLVHYSDSENQVEIQGWVLSRYLKKFQ